MENEGSINPEDVKHVAIREDFPNCVDIQTPSGNFTVIYGLHHEPQVMPTDKFSTLALETGTVGFSFDDQNVNGETIRKLSESTQYGHIFKKIEHGQYDSSIVFVDVQSEDAIEGASKDFSNGAIHTLLAIPGIAAMAYSIWSRQKVSRRNVLKKLGIFGAGASVAGHALMPVVEAGTNINWYDSSSKTKQQTRRLISDMMDNSHRYIRVYLSIIRNLIAAHKSYLYSRYTQQFSGESTNMGVIFGANHTGIENILGNKKFNSPEEQEQWHIQVYGELKGLLSDLGLDDELKHLNDIVECSFDRSRQEWQSRTISLDFPPKE